MKVKICDDTSTEKFMTLYILLYNSQCIKSRSLIVFITPYNNYVALDVY